jgi:drug/metabolite transporter (DMT)-like permease
MAVAAKLASRTMPGEVVAFFRFLFMLAPFALRPSLARSALSWQRGDLLLYRGVFGGTAVLLYFLAIEHVPVGMATLLNYSSPIWAVLFAALFLGERTRPMMLVPFSFALAGMVLVTGALDDPQHPFRLGTWEAAGLLSSVLSGAAVASIRAARRSESSWSIYGSFTLCGLLVTAPFAAPKLRWPNERETLLLVAVGLASVGAQLLMTYAYRWVTNLQAGVFAQITVVVAMALGVLVLGDRFALSQLVGAALAIAGVLGVIFLEAPPPPIE